MITSFILLNNNKIQNFIVHQITEYFEETTGAKFKIEHVSLKFFNKLSLQSIYIEDLSNEKILSIDNLDAKINLLSLAKGDIHIETITANNLSANLYSDTTGTLNIQFLIDAFTPKKKAETPNLVFPLITLNNASFAYVNQSSHHKQLKNWQFDANDIYVDSLYTQIQFSLLEQTNLDAHIKYLRLKEKSGFKLSNLSTYIEITDSSFVIPYTTLDLPNTNLATDSTIIKITRNSEEKIDWAKTHFNFNISKANINLSDLKHFVPELEKLKRSASISAKIDGTVDNI